MAEILDIVERQDADALRTFLQVNSEWRDLVDPDHLLYSSAAKGDACSLEVLHLLVTEARGNPCALVDDQPAWPDLTSSQCALHCAALIESPGPLAFLLSARRPSDVLPSVVQYAVRARNTPAVQVLAEVAVPGRDTLVGIVLKELLEAPDLLGFHFLYEAVQANQALHISSSTAISLIIIACERGHVDIFEQLLSAHGLPEIAESTIIAAASGGNEHIVERLIAEYHTDALAPHLGKGLRTAAHNGSVKVVKMFLDAGASPFEASYPEQWNALHMAVEADDPEVLAVLLEHSPSLLDQTGNNGLTALHRAVHVGVEHSVRALIAHGANINTRSGKQWTPLHNACSSGNALLTELLLESGADVSYRNSYNVSAFLRACKSDSPDTVAAVLRHGGCKDDVDENLDTGLHYAAYSGNTQTIQYLVALGLDLNARNLEGCTPLHDAASMGHIESLRLLMWFGSCATAQDSNGNTPLHSACTHGYTHCAGVLVHAAPSLQHMTNNHGKPATSKVLNSNTESTWTPMNHTKQPGLFREVVEKLMLLHGCSSLRDFPPEIMFEIFKALF